MTWLEKLECYLKDLLGQGLAIDRLPKTSMRGLPLYLSQMYAPYQLHLFGKKLLLLKYLGHEVASPGRIAKDVDRLQKHFDTNVVVVLDELSSWERRRLTLKGIPFIVPGRQLFLPMLLMDLREHFPKRTGPKAEYLSRAAQHTVLRQILFADVENRPMTDVAKCLGYSAMMMTKIRSELLALNLCETKAVGRSRQFAFPLRSQQLWEKSKVHMRSPVFRRHFVVGKIPGLLIAGSSALALQSTLASDNLSVTAVWKKHYEKKVNSAQITEIENDEEADLVVEEWYYDPRTLSDSNAVDPLSLYLSLMHHPNERIQIALKETLEAIPWSKG